MREKHPHPTLVLVPRKLLIAWLTSWVVLFILIGGSYQYTNYTDRKSNKQWCGVVTLFNETYEKSPPATEVAKILEVKFIQLEEAFKCE